MSLVNRFVVCLDSSGSMQAFQKDTVKAFNMNCKAIRDGAEAARQVSTVGLFTFGGDGVQEKAFDAKLDIAMRDSDFTPQGGTPMLDCVGQAIERLRSLRDDRNTSYVVMAFTDGEENTSSKYSWDKLLQLIGEVNATDRWTFTWSVPRGKGRALEARGVPAGNIQEWDLTTKGLEVATANLAAATSNFYSARSKGITSSRSFFTVDANAVKAKDIKAVARDIKNEVHTWTVPKEMDIKSFVESQGVHFMSGRGFYQLTKKEKIQHGKELLLQEKGKTAVYSGQAVRDMLGLPQYGEVTVEPGNVGNWDVYVQSASSNRKLVRGTKLMYPQMSSQKKREEEAEEEIETLLNAAKELHEKAAAIAEKVGICFYVDTLTGSGSLRYISKKAHKELVAAEKTDNYEEIEKVEDRYGVQGWEDGWENYRAGWQAS